MINFQIISDVHLEFYPSLGRFLKAVDIPQTAPYIILAGDIGYPTSIIWREFIKWLSTRYRGVFIVAGNHEYYGNSICIINKIISNFVASIPNVYFLNNKIVLVHGIRVVGTTMWTHIGDDMPRIVKLQKDFKNIAEFKQDPHYVNKLHKEAREFLKKAITPDSIVITHHCPSYRVRHHVQDTDPAYYTDVMDGDDITKPLVWVFGHTHKNVNAIIKCNGPVSCSTLLISNPVGYRDESDIYMPGARFAV